MSFLTPEENNSTICQDRIAQDTYGTTGIGSRVLNVSKQLWKDRWKVWKEGRTEMPFAIVLPKVKPYPITEYCDPNTTEQSNAGITSKRPHVPRHRREICGKHLFEYEKNMQIMIWMCWVKLFGLQILTKPTVEKS